MLFSSLRLTAWELHWVRSDHARDWFHQ